MTRQLTLAFNSKHHRNYEAWRDYVFNGLNFVQIAAKHGISTSRARAIVLKFGNFEDPKHPSNVPDFYSDKEIEDTL